MNRIVLNYSLPAALLLGGVMPVIFGLLFFGSGRLPFHELWSPIMAVVSVVGGLFVAGGLWGRSVALALGDGRRNRVFWVTGLANVVITIGAMQTLGQLELLIVEERALGRFPVHLSFAVLFTLAAGIVTALLVLVVGWQLRGGRVAAKLAGWTGLTAAAAFLLADVVQDLLGRRVGGPNAEATITMLSVAFIGNFVAAFAAGTVLGWRLTRATATTGPVNAPAPESPAYAP